jgi:hypothetical protein
MAETPSKPGSNPGRPFNTTVLIDRPHVRITHTVIQPRAVIPPHPHELDYIVYPINDYNIKRVYHKDDKVLRTVRMIGKAGMPYRVTGVEPGVQISIENDGDLPAEFEKTLNPSKEPIPSDSESNEK